MSFAFALGADELDPDTVDLVGAGAAPAPGSDAHAVTSADAAPAATRACTPLSLAEMLTTLPSRISFSRVPVPRSPEVALYRRDLFDARFQLLLDQEDGAQHNAAPVLSAQSDLIPGQYEGGLKTWECALDLVSVLHQSEITGHQIVELGCGSALPSAFLLSRAFGLRAPTALHLLDYNREVLELVTLPNLVLAWYFSPAGEAHRARFPVEPTPGAGKASIPNPSAHTSSETGELELSPELVAAFEADLQTHGVQLHFYAGDWARFPRLDADLVLTSETIYAPAAQASLLDCLGRLGKGTILVAAKVIYFGVGGSVAAFEEQVQQRGGWSKPLLTTTDGVGRVVLSIGWP